jgi:hypothetical protein
MTVQKFQCYDMGSQADGEPTMHYQTTQSGVSSHKIVDGKQTSTTSGVTSVKTTSKEAGVMIGGVSIHPDEAEAFMKEIEDDQQKEESDQQKAEEEKAEMESKGFDENITMTLEDLDQGSLANAVNQFTNGELTDENIAKAVSSLGFGDEESALEVGGNIISSLSDSFADIAEQEGFESTTGWDAMLQWNKVEAGKALHDWINTRGQDDSRLREALREAWNSYGKASNAQLVEVMQEDGYEVRKTQGGGIAIKGNEFDDWTTWREVRESFKKI